MQTTLEGASLFSAEKLAQLDTLFSGGHKHVVITCHHKPDADALGSSLGLAGFLEKSGHKVRVVTPTDFPAFLDWMPGRSKVLQYDQNIATKAEAETLVADADIIFCLDFNNLSRINEFGHFVGKSAAIKVMIDHHMEPADFAAIMFSDPHAAATAELVYMLIDAMGQRHLIDKNIAGCLYAGIMTDTGSFRHSCTTPRVHRVVADLIELGANNTKIHVQIYDNNSIDRMQLLGYILSEKLVYLPAYKTAYFAITKEELERFNIRTGDSEGFVNYALSLKDVVLGVIIIDRTEMVKMSFRSAANFDVNLFARRYFEGGGHYHAAGGKSADTLEQTIARFLEALEYHQPELAGLHKG